MTHMATRALSPWGGLPKEQVEERIRDILSAQRALGLSSIGDIALRAKLAESFGLERMTQVTKGALAGAKYRLRQELVMGTPTRARVSRNGEQRPRVARVAQHSRSSLSRFGAEVSRVGGLFTLKDTHPAVAKGHTLFPSTVQSPAQVANLLVSGHNNPKVGQWVEKGEWQGFPIYTLTLEERATCARTCHHWTSCMGNSMHRARRHEHGYTLEARLNTDLAHLQRTYPSGFVVRLHILGDFYNFAYIAQWKHWLEVYPALHVFGYTARLPGTLLGEELLRVRTSYWPRFAIRFSRPKPVDGFGEAITVPDVETAEEVRAIVCPAQLHQSATCGTCGLCWSTAQNIAFIHHGRRMRGADTSPRKPYRPRSLKT